MNDRNHAAQSTSSQLQQLQMQLQLERQQAQVARQQQLERGSSVGANRRSKPHTPDTLSKSVHFSTISVQFFFVETFCRYFVDDHAVHTDNC